MILHQAFKKFVDGKLKMILDPNIEMTPAVMGSLERLFELAFTCSAPTKADRPNMKEAQELLRSIRKKYDAAASQQRESLEGENVPFAEPYESVRTPRGGRGSGIPESVRGRRGDEESGWARSTRRSEDNTRHHPNRGSQEYPGHRGSHESPSNRGSHEKSESVRSNRRFESDSVRTPRMGSPEEGDTLDNFPRVVPLHVPNHRQSDRRRTMS